MRLPNIRLAVPFRGFLILAAIGAVVYLFTNVIGFATSSTYLEMTSNAASDKRVIAALGEPVHPIFNILWSYSSGSGYTGGNFSVRLQGRKAGAWADGQFFNGSEHMRMRMPNGDTLADVGIPAYHLYNGPNFTGLYWRADGSVLSVHQSENGTVKAYLQPLPDDASGRATTTDARSIFGTFHLQAGNGIGMGNDNCSVEITFADGRAVAKQTGPSDLCDFTSTANAGGVYTRVTTGDIDGPAPAITGTYRRKDGATLQAIQAVQGYDFALTVRPAEPIRMQTDIVEHDGSVRLELSDRCAYDFVFLHTEMTVVQRGPSADCHLHSGTTASGSYTRTSG
jgi:hypothetical protein